MKHHGLIRAIANIGRRAINFVRRAWADHQELIETNASYRHQLYIGVSAVLGALRINPKTAVIATALLALYVAAFETTSGAWRPGFGGPGVLRPDDPDWEF